MLSMLSTTSNLASLILFVKAVIVFPKSRSLRSNRKLHLKVQVLPESVVK